LLEHTKRVCGLWHSFAANESRSLRERANQTLGSISGGEHSA